jgi:hypothetical protein
MKSTILSTILLSSTILTFPTPCHARKALGGSGGLLSRGASSSPSTAGFDSNDPFKLIDIADNNKLSNWIIPPLDSDQVIEKLGKKHRDVAYYITNELGKAPLSIQLLKKRVGMASSSSSPSSSFSMTTTSGTTPSTTTFSNQDKYRAQVIPKSVIKPSSNQKSKMKSVWYISSDRASSQTSIAKQQKDDLLTKSYDENSSLFHPTHFVLEVFLPKTRQCRKNGGGNPLIRYCIPMGAGTTSNKSRVSQSNGVVTIFPNGRKRKDGAGDNSSECIEVGSTSLHLNVGSSLVDPTWARGRKYFWKGRNVGQV